MNFDVKTCMRWTILLSVAIIETAASAVGKTFSDSTFNLADYSQATFQTGGGTVNVSQTTTGGNPGSALVVITDTPATHTSYAAGVYFVRNSFAWNPASDGSLYTVSWNEDVYLTNTPSPTTSIGGDLFVFQSGNYYINYQSLPTITGVFQTASGTNLIAANFSLVTDLPSGGINTSVHPNFAAPLTFGLLSNAFQTSADADHTVVKIDNLSIQAVSEISAADFNGNHAVEAGDYVIWRNNYGDAPRYDLWRRNFGRTITAGIGSGSAYAVPEPVNVYLALLGLSALTGSRWMKRQ
jgi:hypothetical protein